MVGSIKNIAGQRVEVSKVMTENKGQSEKLSDTVPSTISGSKVDAVLTSKSREALKVMAENPSINMEAVERIKQKIKDGEYPIDFDKLADKLLESYWHSESWKANPKLRFKNVFANSSQLRNWNVNGKFIFYREKFSRTKAVA